MKPRQREESIERLLRQSRAQAGDATDSCLDAETVAAWSEGSLSGDALELAQAHVSDCARCRTIVSAVARLGDSQTTPAAPSRRWIRLLVPLAAAAVIAVAVFVARLPGGDTSAPELPQAVLPAPATIVAREEAPAREVSLALPPAVAAVADSAAVAPTQTTAAAPGAQVIGEVEFASPDRSVRWRIVDRTVQRSTNRATTWETVPTDVTATPAAGSAPTPNICWLVGRGGVVLLSVDGVVWRRVAFPEPVDLVAVQAVDARSASVTATDGRVFRTADGGATWARQ